MQGNPPNQSFLGDGAFGGGFQPRRGNAVTGGRATYHGRVVFTNLDRAVVNEVIPQGLQLAPNISPTPNLHPVIFMYGTPTNGQWLINGLQYTLGTRYNELMLLIPFVCRNGSDRWHTFSVRIYLDNTVARDIGNVHYGYAKRMATFTKSRRTRTTFVNGQACFTADFKVRGPWVPDAQAQALPNYSTVQKIFEMPIVGRHALGHFVCSYFELNYTSVRVARLDSSHEFLKPFTNEMVSWTGLGPLNNVPDGAFAVRHLDWRIKFPPMLACEF